MKSKISNQDLYSWCLEQASDRYCGTLSQDKIDKLNQQEFPWTYYENELDKLGYHWKKNNPNGLRVLSLFIFITVGQNVLSKIFVIL